MRYLYSLSYYAEVSVYIVFTGCQSCHVDEAILSTLQVPLFHVDHTQVVSSLHVVRLY